MDEPAPPEIRRIQNPEVDGNWAEMHPVDHARTDGRTTRKHSVSGVINSMGGDTARTETCVTRPESTDFKILYQLTRINKKISTRSDRRREEVHL